MVGGDGKRRDFLKFFIQIETTSDNLVSLWLQCLVLKYINLNF